nr:uncharacterized protein LOC103911125 [Danio rerio]XP_021332310.1 uncharacterized protein LOC103911125 [Danio rerio]|eukprot:XP_009300111.1 uncharacterized protein LOC103911125 [Danio rerio]
MCPMLQRLQPACASPDGRSQGGQLGREAAASRAGRRPRGHAEDTVPGPGMSPDASPPRQALEAARGALDLGKERGYGEGETPESSSGVAVTAVHPACNPRRVPASIVLRGGAGLGGPRGRPPVRRPRLQARHRAHTGSAHGPGETGYQDAVHPAPNHTPLPGAKEGRRGEKEEEEGQENQVASCTTASRARGGRRSDAPRASGGFGAHCLPVPGPRPRAEPSLGGVRRVPTGQRAHPPPAEQRHFEAGENQSLPWLHGQGHRGARGLPLPQPTSPNPSVGRPARSDAHGRAHQAALPEERGSVPRLPLGDAAGRLSALQHGSGSDSKGGQSPHPRHTPACRRARGKDQAGEGKPTDPQGQPGALSPDRWEENSRPAK